MGWQWLIGSWKVQVCFARQPLSCRALLHKRPGHLGTHKALQPHTPSRALCLSISLCLSVSPARSPTRFKRIFKLASHGIFALYQLFWILFIPKLQLESHNFENSLPPPFACKTRPKFVTLVKFAWPLTEIFAQWYTYTSTCLSWSVVAPVNRLW